MIDTPTIRVIPAQQTAAIHLHIPVEAMAAAFPKALAELSAALQQQNISPVGPVFAHHFRRPSDTFDFDVCIPVPHAIASTGRVEPISQPALHVVQTTYYGDYASLPHAWGDFITQVQTQAHNLRGDFLEAYVAGPHQHPDPNTWRTELSVILADSGDRA